MVKIILCEGNTDQILIGYYLNCTSGWKFTNDNLHFVGESINWFEKGNDVLGIWECNGHDFAVQLDRIKNFIFSSPKLIDKVVIISDNDDNNSEINVKNALTGWTQAIASSAVDIKRAEWVKINANTELGACRLALSYILLPRDESGALETFMLSALAENNEDMQCVIEQVKSFVQNVKSDIYLRKRRERTKAELGVSLAIFSPDKIFMTMNEIINSVKWESYTTVVKAFDMLSEI